MTDRRVSKLLDQFAAAEREFLNQEFLAPAVRDGVVHVRIAGVIMKMKIDPADFRGWGVFLPITHESALLVREATLSERRRYMVITAKASLILCDRKAGRWTAVAAGGAGNLQIDSTVPVQLVDGGELFDTVRAGFDGVNFWFDRVDPSADAATAAWLRSSLAESVEPKKLQRSGLTADQRAAYALHFFSRIKNDAGEKQVRLEKVEAQLRDALAHAGGRMDGYFEHRDGIRVSYTIGGQRHVSSVDKQDLTVQVAGICLSGQDSKFDLASLVGVLNESSAQYAVPVGEDGISEDEYWDIHPPQQ